MHEHMIFPFVAPLVFNSYNLVSTKATVVASFCEKKSKRAKKQLRSFTYFAVLSQPQGSVGV